MTISAIFKHQIHFASSYFIKTCRNILIYFSYILRMQIISNYSLLKKSFRICLMAVSYHDFRLQAFEWTDF